MDLPGSVEMILRLPQVVRMTGLSVATLYRLIDQGKFPRQVGLGGRAVGWPLSHINAWIDARISAAHAA
ncbi:MAG: AlpA family transcriptional regulator [Magnetococcales bacterium]|nr:AlpA family transcriptional regulator [Magnetococcales bacterium]